MRNLGITAQPALSIAFRNSSIGFKSLIREHNARNFEPMPTNAVGCAPLTSGGTSGQCFRRKKSKAMKSRLFCLLTALYLTLPASLEARTWKEANSERSLEGEFARTEGDTVVIVRSNGSSVKIPVAKLTDEDKKFVAEQSVSKPQAATADIFKWETDLNVAKKRAKDENKEILADFTGSDWCGWCIKLKKEVFDQPEFQ